VEFIQIGENSFEMRQPFLIQKIRKHIGMSDDTAGRTNPVGKPLLYEDSKGLPRKHSWNYRAAVGMLNYLQNSTRGEIAMAVHQCARFNNNPMLSHERAINRIVRYLKQTEERGVIYTPDKTRGIECYVDADFAGSWTKSEPDDASNVMSRTGFIITYANCPVLWSSRLQSEIALSTAEAEYIALSTAMRDVIPFMSLLKELSCVFPLYLPKPKIVCKVYEDNQSCIAIAESQRFSPRTKHIAIKYHHFRRFVQDKTIVVQYVRTREQTADILTKPLDDSLFLYLRKRFMGW